MAERGEEKPGEGSSYEADAWLTTATIASELQVNPETVRRWVRSGSLPETRLGHRSSRIKRSDLDAFLAARAHNAPDQQVAPALPQRVQPSVEGAF